MAKSKVRTKFAGADWAQTMVKGIEQMRAKMQKHLAAATAAGKRSAGSQSDKLVNAMKFVAPADQGELIRSIRAEETHSITTNQGESGFFGYLVKAGDETTIVTNERGEKYQNAWLQEHGTKNMPATPFFYPTYRANRRQIRAAIRAAISRAWRQGSE